MPKRRYERREPTDDWQQLRPLLKDTAQINYEVIRPKSRPERNRSASHLVAYIVKILSKNEEFFVAVL